MYGIELRNDKNQVYLGDGDVSWSYFGRKRFTKAMSGTELLTLDVDGRVPTVNFIAWHGSEMNINSSTSIAITSVPWIQEESGKIVSGFHLISTDGGTSSNMDKFSDDFTVYTFVPTKLLKQSEVGFEVYDDLGDMVFTGARPLLMVKDIYKVTTAWSGKDLVATPHERTFNYTPAIRCVGYGTNRWGRDQYSWFAATSGNKVYRAKVYQINTTTWMQPSMRSNGVVSTIDVFPYTRFNNLDNGDINIPNIPKPAHGSLNVPSLSEFTEGGRLVLNI